MISGSVVVPSLCRAVWDGINYPLFGVGERLGALEIQQNKLY